LKSLVQLDTLFDTFSEPGADLLMKRLAKHRPSPAMGVALVALFVALGGTAYAATGGTFILGQANTATSQTSLTAGVAGTTTGPRSVLSLRNTSTASGAEGLGITVGANKAPIHVNSTAGKATFLNADKVDGKNAAELVGARAYATFESWNSTTNFANLFRPKGVAYIVNIGIGHWCVGVNGISATDPDAIAIVSDFRNGARWQHINSGCVAREFEIRQSDSEVGPYSVPFTIVIP
jgi:hypothetical protein